MKVSISANNWFKKIRKRYHNLDVNQYSSLDFFPEEWSLIYLYGNLGMWKTTLVQALLWRTLWEISITSPTYTYYNYYHPDVYHFDLYRLTSYDEFFHIWGEDILLERRKWLIFVEWPERIDQHIKADYSIHIYSWKDEIYRDIVITPQHLS